MGVYRKVAMRLAAVINRKTEAFFGAWRLLVVTTRAGLNLALEHRRAIVLGRVLTAWAKAAAELHLETVERVETAEEHLYLTRAAKAWHCLARAVEGGRARREALLRVMRSQAAVERTVCTGNITLSSLNFISGMIHDPTYYFVPCSLSCN